MSEKPKPTITAKQKEARLKNLENGRKKRMELIKQRKEQDGGHDLSSSEENNTESDSDSGFIISKKKPNKKVAKRPERKRDEIEYSNNLKSEFDELKNIVMEMAVKQNKQAKKKSQPKSGGTNIVVMPPQNTQLSAAMEALRKSVMQ